ncbi:heterokaryon incompatibility protein-domain-containing protein [Hypoxylon cercidicola]|nr:heterokaryon incompatibility protein-domain-containing protein [Hypoxylon cercidicola]
MSLSSLYDSLPLSIDKKSIRVLDLDGNIPDSPAASLQGVVDLTDKPVFTALSYVWGAHHSPPHEICCDGVSIQITLNCWAALCALRRNFGPITVWVDSICVNQQDEKERETQIPLMGDIYSSAASAYIWLGEEGLQSDSAVDYLRSAGFQNYFTSVSDLYFLSQMSTWVYWEIAWFLSVRKYRDFLTSGWKYGFLSGVGTLWSSIQGPPDKLILYETLKDFFSREWAYRVWTLQEAILAKNPVICCGQNVLEWRSIIYSIAYLEHASQNYGVALPEANFGVWRNIVLLWLFVNPEGRPQDRLDNSLTSDITLQRFMPEYWGFLDGIALRHRRLAFIALTTQIIGWYVIIFLIQWTIGTGSIRAQLVGAVIVLIALIFVGIFLADPVFRWPVNFPRETIKRDLDIPSAVLHELCARQATNPRDKFYGMYAIFSRLDVQLSPPNYSRTPEEVHREAFLALLSWTDSLGLLLCSSGRKSEYESSWVPDWGEDITQKWFEASYLFRKRRYDATPLSHSTWSLRRDRQLVLKGAIISSIVQHTEPFQFLDDEAIRQRFERPLLINTLGTFQSYCRLGNPVLTRFSKPDPRPPSAPDSVPARDMSTFGILYWVNILNSLSQNDRILFQTSIPGRNTVGSCPKRARVGDLIVLASGVPLPLVLRPEGDSYLFIGFAEVDGLMKGEVWGRFTDEDLDEIVLV